MPNDEEKRKKWPGRDSQCLARSCILYAGSQIFVTRKFTRFYKRNIDGMLSRIKK